MPGLFSGRSDPRKALSDCPADRDQIASTCLPCRLKMESVSVQRNWCLIDWPGPWAGDRRSRVSDEKWSLSLRPASLSPSGSTRYQVGCVQTHSPLPLFRDPWDRFPAAAMSRGPSHHFYCRLCSLFLISYPSPASCSAFSSSTLNVPPLTSSTLTPVLQCLLP